MRRLAIACLAACHAQAPPHRAGDEYLAAVRIEGNHAIARDELVHGLALSRGTGAAHDVDEYELAVDTTRIVGIYERRGYFEVEVKPRVERKGDATTVVFAIVEGPRARARVELVDLPPDVSPTAARALVAVADGAPFDYTAFDDAKQPLVELLENAGYAHARMVAEVLADRARATAVLRYTFAAGPRCTFGEVAVRGVDGALADAVRARVAFRAGDRYSAAALAKTRRALYGMARFSTVRVAADDKDAAATTIRVDIDVTEGSRNDLRVGGGFAIDPVNLTLRFPIGHYTRVGWPTSLSTLNLDVVPGFVAVRAQCGYELWRCDYQFRGRALGTVTRQDLFRTYMNGDVQGGLDYLVIEAYTITGGRLRVGLSSPIGSERVLARVGYQFGVYGFGDFNPALDAALKAQIGVDHTERLGAVTQSLVVDLRDKPIDTRYGAYAELRAAEGTRYVGGAYDYVQLTPELRGFVPLGFAVLALRARVGAIIGDVPPTERYYAGGASSHRGFAERQLSPFATGADGHTVVYGGAGLIETGAELRLRYGKVWGLQLGEAIFLDGGDVTMTPGELDVWNLHWALGTGMRLHTPIGPLRVDVGYRLNRYGAGEPQANQRVNLAFSVGEAF
jgi:outer membrane protein assembly factor BamA